MYAGGSPLSGGRLRVLPELRSSEPGYRHCVRQVRLRTEGGDVGTQVQGHDADDERAFDESVEARDPCGPRRTSCSGASSRSSRPVRRTAVGRSSGRRGPASQDEGHDDRRRAAVARIELAGWRRSSGSGRAARRGTAVTSGDGRIREPSSIRGRSSI